MQLVEQHVIDRHDSRYAAIDTAAFASKNLYNAALYVIRQTYIFEGRYLSYTEMDRRMQQHEEYKTLPAKVAQQVLQQLDKAWQSFFEARKAYQRDPSAFLAPPGLPRYKHKTEGRNLVVYTRQALSKKALKRGLIQPSMLSITVKTRHPHINQVRIVPKNGYYVVEVVYEKEVQPTRVNPALYAGVDIGVNNLAAIASNKPGFVPVIVNGRPVKSINQYYNKRRAQLQEKRKVPGRDTHRMERLSTKRNRRIDHYLHTASRQIIELLVREGIGTLVIGKNPTWKQQANLGKRRTQNFVYIPHARFIDMLAYKAQLVGIRVHVTEESYTSKASFLDLDELPVYHPNRETSQEGEKHTFSGKRITRGLYRVRSGSCINADVNGAYNIIRKVAPGAFTKGQGGAIVHPVQLLQPSKHACTPSTGL
jgi:IS605 OrfB family transposase